MRPDQSVQPRVRNAWREADLAGRLRRGVVGAGSPVSLTGDPLLYRPRRHSGSPRPVWSAGGHRALWGTASPPSAKPRVLLIDDRCDDALGYHEVLPVLGPLAAGGPRTESGWSDVGFRLDGGSTVDVEFSDEAA
jgi:hypothetical protein